MSVVVSIDERWLAARYADGMSCYELAEELGVNRETVRRRLHKCGVKIRRHLHKPIDAGTRFGQLVVLERCDDGRGGTRAGVSYRCRCDCGNERVCEASALRRGHAKACGPCARLQYHRTPTIKAEPVGGELYPSGPFVVYLLVLLGRGWSQQDLAVLAGTSERTVRRLLTGEFGRVRLDVVDRLVMRIDADPSLVTQFCPINALDERKAA